MIVVTEWALNYETVSDGLRRNGDRHAARAKVHLAAGKPDWAAASMRKAERNWARAKAAEPPEWTKPIVDMLAQRVVWTLLEGR